MNRLLLLALLFFSNPTLSASVQSTAPSNCIPPSAHYQFTPQQKTVAANYALYAVLSHNIYRNEAVYFRLPNEWQNVYSFGDSTGLNYKIFEKLQKGKVVEAVMVFRGTENGRDWIKGNFTNTQYKHARAHISRFITGYKDIPKTLTGHSLGGDLAIYASYEFDDVTAVGFNTNTREYHGQIRPNTRVIISEKGDFEKKFSHIWNPKRWMTSANLPGIFYQQYDFVAPGVVKAHESYPLAQGLIMLGSLQNPEVDKILRLNCPSRP